MISVRPASQPSVAAIFSDIINVISVKLGMMVVLIELYPLIPLSVTLIISALT